MFRTIGLSCKVGVPKVIDIFELLTKEFLNNIKCQLIASIFEIKF